MARKRRSPKCGGGSVRNDSRLQISKCELMPIEIEKKYRLTPPQRRAIEKRMRALGYKPKAVEFEENTIYRGGKLRFGKRALRLRRVNGDAMLTFKERIPTKSLIKHQREQEVRVLDPDGVHVILDALGFTPALIYE